MIETSRVDSPHGSWTQSLWKPAPGDSLAGSVERIWDFEGRLESRRERIFPSGLLELVVQLDEPHRAIYTDRAEGVPALCLDGLATVAATIEAPLGRIRVLGISLHPCGAYALLGAALGEFNDRHVDLRAILGARAEEFAERLERDRHGHDRVGTAVRWLRASLRDAWPATPLVRAVARAIDREPGAPILQIRELRGRSRSRFAASFAREIGLTPKRYARIVRFRRALEALGTSDALSAVAAGAGYYDQAHMNAEFGEHSGLSPRAYLDSLQVSP